MTKKEERERLEQIKRNVRRATSIGINTINLKPKSLTALDALFRAIDKCMDEWESYRKDGGKFLVNPTNLERYGISRSTVNSNPVLRQIVSYYENAQKRKYIAIKRSELEFLREELERLKVFQENAVKLALDYEHLREEFDELKRRFKQQSDALAKTVKMPLIDFNAILHQPNRDV